MNEPRRTNVDSAVIPLDEERAVVERLQAGDRSAFATLYAWYGDRLYRQVIWPRVEERVSAEDVLRDTFRIALEKITSFQYDGVSIFFWLRRIAINRAMDTHRVRTRDRALAERVQAELEDSLHSRPAAPDADLDRRQLRGQIETSLSRLNDRYATVLRMRLLEDRPREECAEALDIKVGTLDVLLHRACKAFRKVFPP